MGIRGAWSVVSNDPHRFGEPWICKKEKSVVWIDGPSLLYFLALEPRLDCMPPSPFHKDQFGQASPATLYQRAVNFLTLVSRSAKSVHVVLDGLCEESKTCTQIDRMKCASQLADEAAYSPSEHRNCKIVSILAELTLVEAIHDLGLSTQGLHFHQPLQGEAEIFIDASIRASQDNEGDHHVILSNDTDFLVHENAPGFVPYSSLHFSTSLDNKEHLLSGFHYSSIKFRRAYFPHRQSCREIMTTVAALAGCDYSDDKLGQACIFIVRSKIGGLKVRQQNKPSASSSFTAVVSYVLHFLSNYGEDWKIALLDSIEVDDIKSSLEVVHNSYFTTGYHSPQKVSYVSVEAKRLLQTRTVYCRPLIETFICTMQAGQERMIDKCIPRRKPARLRKRQRKKRLVSALDASPPERDREQDLPPLECLDVHQSLSMSCAETLQLLNTRSTWTLPMFQRARRRLYSLVFGAGEYVTEWRRSGRGLQIGYIAVRVAASTPGSAGGFMHNLPNSGPDGCHGQSKCIDDIELAASLLPTKLKWLWLLLLTAPDALRTECFGSRHLDVSIANVISVAYYHARLFGEVLRLDEDCSEVTVRCLLKKLDTAVGALIWDIISGMEEDQLPHGFFALPQIVALEKRSEWLINLSKIITGHEPGAPDIIVDVPR